MFHCKQVAPAEIRHIPLKRQERQREGLVVWRRDRNQMAIALHIASLDLRRKLASLQIVRYRDGGQENH